MANTTLFSTIRGMCVPPVDATNAEGAAAYQRSPEAALALYAGTGCLNGTYYASGETQLAQVLMLAAQVDPEFVAKTAVYAREVGHMKDVPALLLSTLSLRAPALFAATFPRVVDNGRMLRNVVQILRSGRVGRKSLGSMPKRLVQRWLQQASTEQLINAAIGQQPSLADVIRMVHPTPVDAGRAALYAWIIGRAFEVEALPPKLQAYEAFKRDPSLALPDLPFQYYTALPLTTAQWTTIARNASWQSLRMNLNTFARHGVFDDEAMVHSVAARLRDATEIGRARVFPYQLLAAWNAASPLPAAIGEALQDAMEIATRQVPVIAGPLVVAVDVSGSMSAPVSGYRKGASSTVRCVDVAALVAASLLRTNPSARVLPFDTAVRDLRLNPRDSVMTQAGQLAALCGGGTAVSAPLVRLNKEKARVDLLVLVSDNESWRDTATGGATQTMREWSSLKARCPQARLVCIDLQPNTTSQSVERDDVLHVGGFSDAVFERLAAFAAEGGDSARWVDRIASIVL
jgi:60 kDa SS-A/Ro ribonucleoprotein